VGAGGIVLDGASDGSRIDGGDSDDGDCVGTGGNSVDADSEGVAAPGAVSVACQIA
jgi:hypothetical protein